MTVVINAGFNRRIPGRKKRFEWMNAVGLEFPVATFAEVTAPMIRAHAKAPKAADGWQVQGWCVATPKDTQRRLDVNAGAA